LPLGPCVTMMQSATALLLLITLPVCLVSAQPGFGGDFGGDKPCPNYRCSKGYSPVPKSRMKFTSKGCGAMGAGVMMMGMGGTSGLEKYSACCDMWHACYQVCGAPKQSCDDSYSQCSKAMCGADDDCTKSADLNGMMVKMGGCTAYDAAQQQACECVEKSKVEEKRADALRYFYKKHAPENVDKVKQLVKKADTSAKMAGLVRKLIKKYPKSITKVVDPQQAMYEEMMNKHKAGDAPDGDFAPDAPEEKEEEEDMEEMISDETQEL